MTLILLASTESAMKVLQSDDFDVDEDDDDVEKAKDLIRRKR